jgi:hypothetical protein
MGPLLVAAMLAAETPTPAQSSAEACRAAYQAREKDLGDELEAASWDRLDPDLSTVESACQGRPFLQVLRTMRAEMQLRQGQPDKALAMLDANPVTASPQLAAYAQWIRLGALEGLDRQDDLVVQRDRMVQANDRTLGDPGRGYELQKVEQIDTPLAVIEAYKGRLPQGPFVRRFIFTARPKAAGMPASVTLTTDGSAAPPGEKGEVFIVDLYSCAGQAPLGQVAAADGQREPDYQAIKAKALAALGEAQAYALKNPKDPPRICAFPEFILPGMFPSPGKQAP